MLVLVLLVCLLSSATPAQDPPDSNEIRLKAGVFDPLSDELPVQLDLPTIAKYRAGVRGAYLVQFDGPITDADRAAIEQAGGDIKGYVPMNTLEVVMTEGERSAVEQAEGVRWVGVHQPAFKVKPGLLDRANADPSAKLNLQVTVFPGEGDLAAGALRGLGVQVQKVDRGRSYELFQVEISARRLNALARISLVRYIEPVYTPMPHNDRGRAIIGLNSVASYDFTFGDDPSLDGSDAGFQVKYGHVDTGLNISHGDFATASISLEGANDDTVDSGGHGTHTAGSIVGDGGLSTSVPEDPPGSVECSGGCPDDLFRGMTPEAALHHISFESGYSDQQMISAEASEGVHISTNSWGYVECKGPFCFNFSPIHEYNSNSVTWDEGVWDADFSSGNGVNPLVVFFSAGNDGNGDNSGCGTSSGDQVGTPGTAKNVITVGGNEIDRLCGGDTRADWPDDVAYFSSRGPVDPDGSGRGLAKPDVTNVATFVLSPEASGQGGSGWDDPNLCSNSGTNYQYMSGTSMSNPLTAGLGGIVLQDLRVNLGVGSTDGKLPRPSLIKALLINGAEDMNPSGGCDYTFQDTAGSSIAQGWGRVNGPNSLYGSSGTPTDRRIDFENEDHSVAGGDTYETTIAVASSSSPLKVTLVWTDYPASAGSGSPLVVNDLDLEVVAPDGSTTYLGNNFSGNWSATGGSPDRYNVVENVYLASPVSGAYTVRVKGFSVSQDQDLVNSGTQQPFSLVWSGDLGAATPVTDLAITEITTSSSSVVSGDSVDLSVTVTNVGNQDVATPFDVTLTDLTDTNVVGTLNVDGLNAGDSTVLVFSWSTSGASLGAHDFQATHDLSDEDTTNDAMTVTGLVTVESAITDIAVTEVSSPTSVTQGDQVSVDVTVENVGNQDVGNNITVSFSESPDGTAIPTQSIVGLVAGASQTLTFTWDTSGASTGDHDLTASHDFGDDDSSNDSLSATVTVNDSSLEVTVTDVDPNSMQAGTSGGVTITGTAFASGASVTFENGSGPAPEATNVNVAADGSSLTATVTARSGGPPRNRVWDVRVTNPDNSSGVLAAGFTVIP